MFGFFRTTGRSGFEKWTRRHTQSWLNVFRSKSRRNLIVHDLFACRTTSTGRSCSFFQAPTIISNLTHSILFALYTTRIPPSNNNTTTARRAHIRTAPFIVSHNVTSGRTSSVSKHFPPKAGSPAPFRQHHHTKPRSSGADHWWTSHGHPLLRLITSTTLQGSP